MWRDYAKQVARYNFNEFAEADSSAPSGRRLGVALLAACRPWEFSVVNALKRRKSA